jgi:hypothetical protein
MRAACVCSILLVFAACAGDSVATGSGLAALVLTEERVVQPPEGSGAELVDPQDLEWGPDGTLVVADLTPAIVKVLRLDGTLVRTIGGEGDGPGEFRAPLIAVRDTILVVFDGLSGRLQTFDLRTGRVTGQYPGPPFVPVSPTLDDEGTVTIPLAYASESQRLHRLDLRTGKSDTLQLTGERSAQPQVMWTFNGRRSDGGAIQLRLPVPLHPRHVERVTPRGSIVVGWSDEYRLSVLDRRGEMQLILSREISAEPMSPLRRKQVIESAVRRFRNFGSEAELRRQLTADLLPDNEPFFSDVFVDGRDRLWVLRSGGDDTLHVRVDVWSPDAAFLGSVRVPRAAWPSPPLAPAFEGDRLAAIKTNADGFPTVIVYRIAPGAP